MRLSLCATALVLCACASGGSSGSGGHSTNDTPLLQEQVEITRVETPGGIIQIDWHRERTYDETKLLVGVDKAWAAVPTVFGELGIDPNIIDTRQHVLGTRARCSGASWATSASRTTSTAARPPESPMRINTTSVFAW